ncbi:MAG: RagB/SusD family nutrient uptake outer membrane protein [Bacteroidota bacterium]
MFVASCTFDEQLDPNAPSANSVSSDASLNELNLLATGIEGTMRNGFETYVTASGSIARELYKFDADPRNTEELLGKDGAPLDNNTFYLTSTYNSRYRVVKNCNILLDALNNTNSVSENEKNGYRGYANTVKALMFTQVLNNLGSNGIRVDVADPNNLGPFLSEDAAWDAIGALLDEAQGQLSGASFAFDLSSGFEGFDTPQTFTLFNRALAARVALYSGDYGGAILELSNSFFDGAGDLSIGPKHVFSTGSGDATNPVFKPAGQSGDQLVVHNRFLDNSTAGDARLSKFRARIDATSQDGLNGTHETALYATNSDPIDIIRNEELILIFAEASIQLGNTIEAVNAINIIRNAHGIGDYTGSTDQEALIDEMLYQRSYSLWGEGII